MQYKGLKYFAKKCDKLYCYGIGSCGQLVARYCKKFHIEIEAYIVSKRDGNILRFNGKAIYALPEIDIEENDGVIIAVSNSVYQEEIKQMLTIYSKSKNWFSLLDTPTSISRYYYRLHKKEISKRKNYSIFDFKRLSQPIPVHSIDVGHYPRDMHFYYYYGYRKCIKRSLRNMRYDFNQSTIQHGAALTFVTELESRPLDGNIFSMSGIEWKNVKNVNVHSIGPYIKYAHPSHTITQIKKLKERLGKVLMVVPDHSTILWDNKFDIGKFILEIERVKALGQYETVIVCLYCIDILRGYYKPYLKHGYKIVTAGYATDENFTSRLKTFIYLSDMVFSNSITTFLGFSIAMGKPVYIYDMDVLPEDWFAALSKVSLNSPAGFLSAKKEVIDAFNTYSEQISEAQISVIKKYWGNWKGKYIL